MEMPVNNPIIPVNEKGKAIDLCHSVAGDTMEDAINSFNKACSRLLNPNIWHELAGSMSASFKLVTGNDDDPRRPAMLYDYNKIDIPGPGSSTGTGYDWVQIEQVEENTDPTADESLAIKLRVCKNPTNHDEATAHFFQEDATSTFVIKRNGITVTASYHGRNELPNSTQVNFTDKIRNSIVAAGATAGLSALQWTALIKGFLQEETGE
jgi:hypothetical protein